MVHVVTDPILKLLHLDLQMDPQNMNFDPWTLGFVTMCRIDILEKLINTT